MTNDQKERFGQLLIDTLSLYRVDITKSMLEIWWEDLSHFDIDAIEQAFSMHRRNPDDGQFAPKPANIVRLLGGTSKDRAIMAWNKAKKAISSVGSYESVVFDDPIIHAVISDMGGWVTFCQGDADELKFRQNDFENRYRTYLFNPPSGYPKVLAGISQTENASSGFSVSPPLTIGNVDACRLVYKGGIANESAPKALGNKLKKIA